MCRCVLCMHCACIVHVVPNHTVPRYALYALHCAYIVPCAFRLFWSFPAFFLFYVPALVLYRALGLINFRYIHKRNIRMSDSERRTIRCTVSDMKTCKKCLAGVLFQDGFVTSKRRSAPLSLCFRINRKCVQSAPKVPGPPPYQNPFKSETTLVRAARHIPQHTHSRIYFDRPSRKKQNWVAAKEAISLRSKTVTILSSSTSHTDASSYTSVETFPWVLVFYPMAYL